MDEDFKRLANEMVHEKIWTGPRKRNLKTDTKSLLIAAQNNAIRDNYDKLKLDVAIPVDL